MFGLGPMELVIILVIVVLLFGVGRLPELGSGLGEGIKNFKKSIKDANVIDATPDSKAADSPSSQTETSGESGDPKEVSSDKKEETAG